MDLGFRDFPWVTGITSLAPDKWKKMATLHLRADRDEVHDKIVDAIRTHRRNARQDPIQGGIQDKTDALASDILRGLDVLVAESADLSSGPRLHRGASEAQRKTVEELADSITEKRLKALSLVGEHTNGITCDELETIYGLAHSSISARLNWLERQGLVERDHDRKYKTRAGGHANPYEITEAGIRVLKSNQ